MSIPATTRTIQAVAVLLMLLASAIFVCGSADASGPPKLPERISLRERTPQLPAGDDGTALLADHTLEPVHRAAWNDAQLSDRPDTGFLWNTISLFGDPRVQLAASGLLYVSGTDAGRDLVPAIVLTGAYTGIGKALTGQARPYLGKGPVFRGPSLDSDYAAMPSAHTSISFAAAAVWSHHYPEMAPAFYAAAGIVGLSRIALDKHWPTNVMIGALLGYFTARRCLQR